MSVPSFHLHLSSDVHKGFYLPRKMVLQQFFFICIANCLANISVVCSCLLGEGEVLYLCVFRSERS